MSQFLILLSLATPAALLDSPIQERELKPFPSSPEIELEEQDQKFLPLEELWETEDLNQRDDLKDINYRAGL